jgi:hypothetical protein
MNSPFPLSYPDPAGNCRWATGGQQREQTSHGVQATHPEGLPLRTS